MAVEGDRAVSVLALAGSRGSSGSLSELAALVGRGHQIVSWSRRGPEPVDVVLVSDPARLAELVEELTDLSLVACRVTSLDETHLARTLGAALLFTSDLALVGVDPGTQLDAAPDAATIFVPSPGVDTSRYDVIAPLTRSQMRVAYGLPDRLVLAVEGTALTPDRSTSLALAAAAVVSSDLVPAALSLGTPTVTDQATADRFDLTDGQEVLVAASSTDADGLAAALAADPDLAGGLSRRARAFAETRLDITLPAERMRRRLGLCEERSLIDLRLGELRTPTRSRLRHRAGQALSIFTEEPVS